MSFFANIFGYLLNFLYEFFQNYGIAIILFSVILKIILLPISVKQQRTMKKSAKIQKELKDIQEKYKSDPMTMNKETMDVYKRENMSPFGGCLSAIVQIVILLSMFFLVRSPLTFMKKVDPGLIKAYTEQIQTETGVDKLTYPEIAIIRDAISQGKKIKAGEEITPVEENVISNEPESIVEESSNGQEAEGINEEENKLGEFSEESSKLVTEEGQEEGLRNNEEVIDVRTPENIEKMYINMELWGLDLSSIPKEQAKDYKVYIIPVLYVLSTFISMKLTVMMTQSKKDNEEGKPSDMDALNQMNKNMSYLMPILSVSISMVAPLGLALYWLVNNILMIAERLVLNKFLKLEEEKNAE